MNNSSIDALPPSYASTIRNDQFNANSGQRMPLGEVHNHVSILIKSSKSTMREVIETASYMLMLQSVMSC